MLHRSILFSLLIVIALPACKEPVSEDGDVLARLPDEVDFNYHIRPILSDRCYPCHGPDSNTREADFRIDTEEGAFARLNESSRNRAIVRGSLRRSELAHRIASGDADYMMPPPESNLKLSEDEVALLRKWIDQGAEWKPHWAFVAPESPSLPEVEDESWVRNPIDRFVLSRLERDTVSPAPEAGKERLLRRVTFDLTGLPPTIEEIDAFLADTSPDAFEKVVDRLLATTAYAERMAVDWMDVARYADSHGYHADGYRMMWPWRDWVIEAFDENMPYDEFIKYQLAGDLLPDATHESRLATAFHRNHQMTAEGGIVDEEYRVEYVVDRTNTTARAFLGLTMECARCHDHKFDPISQKEYYQTFAFFNNVNEVGMTGDDGNAGPMLMLFDDGEEGELKALRDSIAALEDRLDRRYNELAGPRVTAAALEMPANGARIDLDEGLTDYFPLDRLVASGEDRRVENKISGRAPGTVSGEVELVESPSRQGVRFDYDYDFLELPETGLFERYEPFSIGLWVRPEKRESYAVVLGNAGHKNVYWRGYEVFLDSLNQVNVRLINALPHNQIHVRTTSGLPLDDWTHLTVAYDGSSRARGLSVYLDGEAVELDMAYDDLYKSIWPIDGRHQHIDKPLRVGKSYRSFSGENGIFTGAIDDIRIYDKKVTALEAALLVEGDRLDANRRARLEKAHAIERSDEAYLRIRDRLYALRKAEQEFVEPIEEIMVMEEMDPPRETHVLNRGLYDQPLEAVEPGVPEIVLPFSDERPPDRLGLAEWILDPENPLTARVAVNRFWQMYFGTGIVSTPADFGYQGQLPTHPALLDWLAVRFVESGWDVKALQRLIVTSATYRQSSAPRPDLEERDPENKWLARGPRYRLPAEMIRDNALAASGLLVRTVGGPSVKPYQPEGLWIEKGTYSPMLLTYEADKGDGLYRRSLYTFIKRTSPPPSMIAFDGTDRSICIVERQATSTPMQSLILLNDPQYVEASRLIAERMQKEAGDALEDQITLGFRLVTSRFPNDEELALFKTLFEDERQRFGRNPDEASALLSVGDWPHDTGLDASRTAALAVVANTMLNHDEAYMKR